MRIIAKIHLYYTSKEKKIVINEDLLTDDYLNGESGYFENELKYVPYDDIYETILRLQKDPFRRVRSFTIFLNKIKAIRFLLTATLKALRSLPIEMFNGYKNEEIFIEGDKSPRKNTDMFYSVMMKSRNLLFALFNGNSFTGKYIYQFSCIAEYTKEKRNRGNLQFSL